MANRHGIATRRAVSSDPRAGLVPLLRAPFTVRLERQGTTLEVPTDRSLLSVIRDVVPTYPSSCGSGSCGVCETRVLAGKIDHRDRVLSVQECERGDVMMVCVSRGTDDLLVLDI